VIVPDASHVALTRLLVFSAGERSDVQATSAESSAARAAGALDGRAVQAGLSSEAELAQRDADASRGQAAPALRPPAPRGGGGIAGGQLAADSPHGWGASAMWIAALVVLVAVWWRLVQSRAAGAFPL
jgi:hypothetical protein